MPAKIPAHIREQQINDLPNISFVRWDGVYKNSTSKAICRCAIDGFEWASTVKGLIYGGYGCHQCAGQRRWTADERIAQINDLPNISFVRWADTYKNKNSKAICRCALDGFEWAASVHNLINGGCGCPQCFGKRRWTADERIAQINAKPNVSFVRWDGVYKGSGSKAICRCAIDGFEWAAKVDHLITTGSGCPQCAGNLTLAAEEQITKINSLPNISFVRWADTYNNRESKAICRCAVDGFEWPVAVGSLISRGRGCPQCSKHGFNPAAPGTLYILRSECGTMVKIGISNDHEQRHAQLRRATPFDWHCIELLHSDDGSLIAEWEKELHSITEQATFSETFDGYTEWRKWDPRLLKWVDRYRARLERYNKAP